jgi:hypothetical protein
MPKVHHTNHPVLGYENETLDEYNSEAEERLLQIKKKQKLGPIIPEEVERRL